MQKMTFGTFILYRDQDRLIIRTGDYITEKDSLSKDDFEIIQNSFLKKTFGKFEFFFLSIIEILLVFLIILIIGSIFTNQKFDLNYIPSKYSYFIQIILLIIFSCLIFYFLSIFLMNRWTNFFYLESNDKLQSISYYKITKKKIFYKYIHSSNSYFKIYYHYEYNAIESFVLANVIDDFYNLHNWDCVLFGNNSKLLTLSIFDRDSLYDKLEELISFLNGFDILYSKTATIKISKLKE